MGTDQFDSEKELDVNPINTAAFSVMDESIVRKHNYCMAFIPESSVSVSSAWGRVTSGREGDAA